MLRVYRVQNNINQSNTAVFLHVWYLISYLIFNKNTVVVDYLIFF